MLCNEEGVVEAAGADVAGDGGEGNYVGLGGDGRERCVH